MERFLKVCNSVIDFINGKKENELYPWHNEEVKEIKVKPKKRRYTRRKQKAK
jgi:hypothetical protein